MAYLSRWQKMADFLSSTHFAAPINERPTSLTLHTFRGPVLSARGRHFRRGGRDRKGQCIFIGRCPRRSSPTATTGKTRDWDRQVGASGKSRQRASDHDHDGGSAQNVADTVVLGCRRTRGCAWGCGRFRTAWFGGDIGIVNEGVRYKRFPKITTLLSHQHLGTVHAALGSRS